MTDVQPRKSNGRYDRKAGTPAEVGLPPRGISPAIAEFENFVDMATSNLSRGDESRLDILYYKLEALRVRVEAREILDYYQNLDPSIQSLHVCAGNGSDGYSAELYGVERADADGNTHTDAPTVKEIEAFDLQSRALAVPGALEGTFEKTGAQDDYLRDVWRVSRD